MLLNLIVACTSWGAGVDSRMGRDTPWSSRCDVVRVTREIDITTREGIECAKARSGEVMHLTFMSLPCAGGCPWQHINILRGGLTAEKIEDHKARWHAMMDGAEEVAEHNHHLGGYILMEIPSGCGCWGGACHSLCGNTD